MENVMEKLDEYYNRFGDVFPTHICENNQEIIEKVQKCLDLGQKAEKVFNLDYSGGIKY